MITVADRHYLKSALICTVLCLLTLEAMGNKDYFSKEMDQRWSELKPSQDIRAPGGALFLKLVHDIQKSNLQELVAGEMLKAYNTIFTTLEANTQDEKTKANLRYLKNKTEELRKNYFNDSQKQLGTLTHDLKKLIDINPNDDTVQRKAIKEMKLIYNWVAAEATKKNSTSTLRRRRQTRRRSVRPRP